MIQLPGAEYDKLRSAAECRHESGELAAASGALWIEIARVNGGRDRRRGQSNQSQTSGVTAVVPAVPAEVIENESKSLPVPDVAGATEPRM
jgi:hypothetical protein